ncbi:unnamed protein product [Rhizophagus irregularis]|nr:unnamed protein product [Rhizophagus irregularis]
MIRTLTLTCIPFCGCVDTKNEKYKEALRKLFDELETRVATTPIDVVSAKQMKMDDGHGFDKVWGIVTDAENGTSLECTRDAEGKLSFKLSEAASVCCAGMKDMVEKVLGHIIWLLEESIKGGFSC